MKVDFEWLGSFGYVTIHDKNVSNVDPISSPMMTGGVFAINRLFFWKNGGYDPGRMPGWGGEQFELSFKTWLCGGRLDVIPCSHVAHLDREGKNRPYGNVEKSNWINMARVANIWMDEYKSLIEITTKLWLKDDPHMFDIDEQLKLKKKLNCKPFEWYVQNVIPNKFVPAKHSQMYGKIRNGEDKSMCFDNLQVGVNDETSGKLSKYPCHNFDSYSQYFALTFNHELRIGFGFGGGYCAEVKKHHPFDQVELKKCAKNSNQIWKWSAKNGLQHLLSGKCISLPSISKEDSENDTGEYNMDLIADSCVGGNRQLWNFEYSSNHLSTIIAPPKVNGRLRNAKFNDLCLDDYSQEAPYFLQLFPCMDGNEEAATQNFHLSSDHELRHFQECAEVITCDSTDFCTTSHRILMTICNGKEEQKWKRTKWNGLQHIKYNLCLAASLNFDGEGVHLGVQNCQESTEQIWEIHS